MDPLFLPTEPKEKIEIFEGIWYNIPVEIVTEGPVMKVRCEYCQNMVEVQQGADRICPYCGSPLPAAPEPPKQAAPPQKSGRTVLLLLPLLAVVLLFFVLIPTIGGQRQAGDTSQVYCIW